MRNSLPVLLLSMLSFAFAASPAPTFEQAGLSCAACIWGNHHDASWYAASGSSSSGAVPDQDSSAGFAFCSTTGRCFSRLDDTCNWLNSLTSCCFYATTCDECSTMGGPDQQCHWDNATSVCLTGPTPFKVAPSCSVAPTPAYKRNLAIATMALGAWYHVMMVALRFCRNEETRKRWKIRCKAVTDITSLVMLGFNVSLVPEHLYECGQLRPANDPSWSASDGGFTTPAPFLVCYLVLHSITTLSQVLSGKELPAQVSLVMGSFSCATYMYTGLSATQRCLTPGLPYSTIDPIVRYNFSMIFLAIVTHLVILFMGWAMRAPTVPWYLTLLVFSVPGYVAQGLAWKSLHSVELSEAEKLIVLAPGVVLMLVSTTNFLVPAATICGATKGGDEAPLEDALENAANVN